MTLYKIADFNPNYRQEAFGDEDVKGLDIHTRRTDEKIGTIHDILVDETGRFRYLVIDTGFWIFGKKVLLPVGRCHVDPENERVYAMGLVDKEQAEQLPEYDESMTVDFDYEERVRNVYRTPTVEASAPVEMSPPVETSGAKAVSAVSDTTTTPTYNRQNYRYEQESDLYNMDDNNYQRLKLYEERLVATKNRQKTGDVTVGKRVETQTATASVPVEKERVVIERKAPADGGKRVDVTDADFREGTVARIEVYEEKATIDKQAFVREEVSVSKKVEQDTVTAKENLRREELDVSRKDI